MLVSDKQIIHCYQVLGLCINKHANFYGNKTIVLIPEV